MKRITLRRKQKETHQHLNLNFIKQQQEEEESFSDFIYYQQDNQRSASTKSWKDSFLREFTFTFYPSLRKIRNKNIMDSPSSNSSNGSTPSS